MASLFHLIEYIVKPYYDYNESVRVKFQPKHPNYDAAYQGFLFDDLFTRTLNTSTNTIVDAYSIGFE